MPALVILAAGVSRRFGTPKQFEPVGPSGEALMDYAIHDALGAGADRVLLVLNDRLVPSAADRFRSFGDTVQWVIQDTTPSIDRTKPWGTGHAILLASRTIDDAFITVNADDFYGRPAVTIALEHLSRHSRPHALVGFPAGRTLSASGGVSRGHIGADGPTVRSVTEIRELHREPNGLAGVDTAEKPVSVPEDAPVSMNLWAFGRSIRDTLEAAFATWQARWGLDPDREFLIGDVITDLIASEPGTLHLLRAEVDWFGLTFPNDRDLVRKRLRRLVASGAYPSPLFED